MVFGNGYAAKRVIAKSDAALLSAQLAVAPRHPREHMKLLAAVNRRVAKYEKSVSPHCHVSFVSADPRYLSASEVFVEGGEAVKFHMPVLYVGIDLSKVMDQLGRDLGPGDKPRQ
jgi:hypothetical protein